MRGCVVPVALITTGDDVAAERVGVLAQLAGASG
jgi:hypothetical protein